MYPADHSKFDNQYIELNVELMIYYISLKLDYHQMHILLCSDAFVKQIDRNYYEKLLFVIKEKLLFCKKDALHIIVTRKFC